MQFEACNGQAGQDLRLFQHLYTCLARETKDYVDSGMKPSLRGPDDHIPGLFPCVAPVNTAERFVIARFNPVFQHYYFFLGETGKIIQFLVIHTVGPGAHNNTGYPWVFQRGTVYFL